MFFNRITDIENFVAYLVELFECRIDDQSLIDQLYDEQILVSGFEIRYLINITDSMFVVKTFEQQSSIDYNVYLNAKDGYPYRMQIRFDNNRWQLKSFMFQCAGCFAEEESCDVCGGSGWGVL